MSNKLGMLALLVACLTWFLVPQCLCSAPGSPDYNEFLKLKILPHEQLLASFSFSSNTSTTAFENSNFRYFPRALGQIIQHAKVRELHLRFTTGRWDEDSWGMRPRRGLREGGTGVEFWAWVDAEDAERYGFIGLQIGGTFNGTDRILKRR